MRIEPSEDQVTIVLIGAFNPRIFHPSWFAWKNLIPKEAVDRADISFIIPDATQFVANYMTFLIQTNRFQVQCQTIYKDLIRDLTLSTFQEHLPECPVWQMGINRTVVFSCGAEADRDRLGSLLAPKEPWGEWGKEIARATTPPHGGMVRLIMNQQPRPDGRKGHIQADVQPAVHEPGSVVVHVNSHIDLAEPDKALGSSESMNILNNDWEASIKTAEFIVNCLMETSERLK